MNFKIGLVIGVICFSIHSFANDKHEVDLSTSGQLAIASGGTRFGVSTKYDYLLEHNIQAGFNAGFSVNSATGTTTVAFPLLVGPTLNIPYKGSRLMNAFFVSAMGGIVYSSGAGETFPGFITAANGVNLALQFEAGKRFQLFERFSYKPSASLTKVFGNNWVFGVKVISFSLVY